MDTQPIAQQRHLKQPSSMSLKYKQLHLQPYYTKYKSNRAVKPQAWKLNQTKKLQRIIMLRNNRKIISLAKSYSWAMPTQVNPMRIVMPRSKSLWRTWTRWTQMANHLKVSALKASIRCWNHLEGENLKKKMLQFKQLNVI